MVLDTADIVYITAECIIGITSIVLNSIVVVAILKTHGLHTVPNVFITSLCVADIFVGLLVCPLSVFGHMDVEMSFTGCLLFMSQILVFTNASILCLLGVSFERLFAIKKPMTYKRTLTIKRAIFIVILIWLLALFLGLVPVFGWHADENKYQGICKFLKVISIEFLVYFQSFGLVLLPLTINICIYSYIFYTVHKHERTDRKQRSTIAFNTPPSNKKLQPPSVNKKEIRVAKIFFAIIGLFILTKLPINIWNHLNFFCPTCPVKSKEVKYALIILTRSNSIVNPILYAYINTSIRKSTTALIRGNSTPILSRTGPSTSMSLFDQKKKYSSYLLYRQKSKASSIMIQHKKSVQLKR